MFLLDEEGIVLRRINGRFFPEPASAHTPCHGGIFFSNTRKVKIDFQLAVSGLTKIFQSEMPHF